MKQWFRWSRIKVRALLLGMVPAAILAITLVSYIVSTQISDLEEAFAARGESLARETAALSLYGLFIGDVPALTQSVLPILKREDVEKLKV